MRGGLSPLAKHSSNVRLNLLLVWNTETSETSKGQSMASGDAAEGTAKGERGMSVQERQGLGY